MYGELASMSLVADLQTSSWPRHGYYIGLECQGKARQGQPFFYMAFVCCVNVYMVSVHCAHEQHLRRTLTLKLTHTIIYCCIE